MSAEIRLRQFGPIVAAVLAVAVVARVWDIRAPLELEHDQASYLLQAEIFSTGRWTAPAPPIPEFFEQPHVQVVPALASKYPPGHALVLSLGSVFGAPWLIPFALTGLTTALLFALVARTVSVWAAPFACVVWMTAPIVLRFQGSYFSETTTAALTLAGWWCILEWRQTRAAHWMAFAALAIGWSAITRPMTALALAIPVGILVLRDVASSGRWRDVALGVVVGTTVLGVIPLWSAKTTGSWRETPLIKYQRDYLPFDKPGFAVDSTPPRRLSSFDPVIRHMYQYFLNLRTEQSPGAIPGLALRRLVLIVADWFQGFRLVLIVFAVIGLVRGGPVLRFAALSGALVVLAYLTYAHWHGWTIYYLELAPVAAAATACGVWFMVSRYFDAQRAARVMTAAAVALFVLSIQPIETNRVINHNNNRYYRVFAEAMEALPSKPAIVFAFYDSTSRTHRAVVRNFADLRGADVWIVHDLGARNRELMTLAPNRAVYYFEADRR